MKMRWLTTICLGATMLVGTILSGCETLSVQSGSKAHPGKGHGPPKHAPAHGHHKKHKDGTKLVYDSGLGVYAVVDMPNVYFLNDKYLRYRDARWQLSVSLNEPWATAPSHKVPASLKKKHPPKKKHEDKQKDKGKQKGKDKHKAKQARGYDHTKESILTDNTPIPYNAPLPRTPVQAKQTPPWGYSSVGRAHDWQS